MNKAIKDSKGDDLTYLPGHPSVRYIAESTAVCELDLWIKFCHIEPIPTLFAIVEVLERSARQDRSSPAGTKPGRNDSESKPSMSNGVLIRIRMRGSDSDLYRGEVI